MEMAATTTASTAGTMSTEARQRRRGAAGAAPFVMLALGVALLALAAPRIAAHAELISLANVRAALVSGAPLPEDRLQTALIAYDCAIEWRPADPAFRRDRAIATRRLARLELAEGEYRECDSGCLKRAALDDLRVHARLAPGDGFVWALYADAGIELGEELEAAFPALRLARLTAPSRASALLVHYRLAMLHWDRMPREEREHGLRHAADFWKKRSLRPLLVEIYLEAGFPARAAFREAMGEGSRGLMQFDRMLLSGAGLSRRG